MIFFSSCLTVTHSQLTYTGQVAEISAFSDLGFYATNEVVGYFCNNDEIMHGRLVSPSMWAELDLDYISENNVCVPLLTTDSDARVNIFEHINGGKGLYQLDDDVPVFGEFGTQDCPIPEVLWKFEGSPKKTQRKIRSIKYTFYSCRAIGESDYWRPS